MHSTWLYTLFPCSIPCVDEPLSECIRPAFLSSFQIGRVFSTTISLSIERATSSIIDGIQLKRMYFAIASRWNCHDLAFSIFPIFVGYSFGIGQSASNRFASGMGATGTWSFEMPPGGWSSFVDDFQFQRRLEWRARGPSVKSNRLHSPMNSSAHAICLCRLSLPEFRPAYLILLRRRPSTGARVREFWKQLNIELMG